MARVTTRPGEILLEEFLLPTNTSARALAEAIGVPPNRVTSIINGSRGVTADTAIRFGLFFKTTPEFWMNLQQAHDLSKASKELTFAVAAFEGVIYPANDLAKSASAGAPPAPRPRRSKAAKAA